MQTLSQCDFDDNEILNQQVDLEGNFNQQSDIKQEILNFNHLQFALTQQLKGHDQEVRLVSISNDDKYIASSSSTYPDLGIVILWDLQQNKQITQYKSEYADISALQFSKENNMLGVCSDVQVWGEIIIEIFDLTNLKNTQAKIRVKGHTNSIYGITFTNDSNHLISVSVDQSLRVWDLIKQVEIYKQNCGDSLYGVTYSHEQQLIACCGFQGLAYLFDCRTLSNLKLKVKWQAHSNHSYCIEFIRSSAVLMTSSNTETRFWLVDDLLKQKFNYFKEIDGGWTVIAHQVDNPKVIINCSSDNKFINLWDYNSTELIQRHEIPDGVHDKSFAITSDIRKIIARGNNKMVNIFEQQEKK